eukprot:1356919-Prymnesium_polylepis.1
MGLPRERLVARGLQRDLCGPLPRELCCTRVASPLSHVPPHPVIYSHWNVLYSHWNVLYSHWSPARNTRKGGFGGFESAESCKSDCTISTLTRHAQNTPRSSCSTYVDPRTNRNAVAPIYRPS